MADLFTLTTPDSRFDKDKPVLINGYLFVPAEREPAMAGAEPPLPFRRAKAVVEVKRRKVVSRG